MKKLALHWQIIIGLILGVLFGIVAAVNQWGQFTSDWIAPFGTIFVNLLKLIAVPLVMASLISGVASLADLHKLSRMGGKTIAIYLLTTVAAICIGLTLVNTLRPGDSLPDEVAADLQSTYQQDIEQREGDVEFARERGPLQPIVDMVPENVIGAAGSNRNMLQVVFFALFLGIGLVLVRNESTEHVLKFFQGLNDVIIKMVDVIMLYAPVGVFALIADTITSIAGDSLTSVLELLGSLGFYSLVVFLGLLLHVLIVYSSMIHFLSPVSLREFYRGISPAQLLAFSTSSSAATLPVTMECVEDNLGVKKEVASFVLPLGATINLDGTALYQSVAAVFIAQALGMQLDFAAQLTIVLTALLASIGAAPVPGAGLIMLVIILEAIGVPSAGVALILGVDRILDMLRTTANVTGDATVTILVNASEAKADAEEKAGDSLSGL
ncbi:MAG: dicarboxylate/amino acid:cation symporter [Woeseiaceae bacterium]|nr:dicarboxylate/amino acid:cation symporter [Woeseiaceae bacterium]